MGYTPIFEVGQRVKVIHGEMCHSDAGAHIGKVGTVRDILVPNSDPEVYQVALDGVDKPLWFGHDELEALGTAAQPEPPAP